MYIQIKNATIDLKVKDQRSNDLEKNTSQSNNKRKTIVSQQFQSILMRKKNPLLIMQC